MASGRTVVGGNIKSNKTMFRLARAKALGPIPVEIHVQNRTIVGYGMSESELKTLYTTEGFDVSTEKAAWKRHLAAWEDAGLVIKWRDMIFFVLGAEDIKYDENLHDRFHGTCVVYMGAMTE